MIPQEDEKMTVDYKTWNDDKMRFFKKHKNDFNCYTSSMDEYGCYHKEYVFADHAIWYESMMPTWEKTTVEIKKVKVDVEVKMFRTEYWSTDDSESKCYYEKF